MDLRSGIFASAQALGVSPYDLATAISYETAGTFDPLKRGPTTQWGQHRGLIQFGEPQAQEYGVNWDDPIGSQLGPEGAVVKYLKQTGVKPGMGLLDIYSAINAGGVGRYGASDANNGGAPGTVRDKVEKQMAGHRDKAMALLGSEGAAPSRQQAAQEKPTMQGILGMIGGGQPQQRQQYSGMGDPRFWNDLAGAFATMSGNPDLIQSVQMTQARQEQKDQRNSTTDYLRSIGRDDLADAFQNGMIGAEQLYSAMQPAQPEMIEINGQLVDKRTGQVMGDYRTPETPDQTSAMQNFEYMVGTLGIDPEKAREVAFGSNGVTVNNRTDPAPPSGYRNVYDDDGRLVSQEAIPGGPEDSSKMEATAASNAATASDTVTTAAARAREAAGNRNLGSAGTSLVGRINPLSDSAEVMRQVDVLKSTAKIENLTAMRAASPTGGALGSVTEKESQMLAEKSGALDPNSQYFERDLDDYERTLLRVIHGREAGDAIFAQTRKDAAAADASDDDLLKKYGG